MLWTGSPGLWGIAVSRRRKKISINRWVFLHSLRLFRIRGRSEQVARGFALGLAVNFFPTFGFGILISGILARALGGNGVAGFAGGALLTFFWPLLFYLNIRVGGLFHPPPVRIDEPDDITPRMIDMLVWGLTFSLGAVINALIVGLGVYFLLLVTYERIRPRALLFFRERARLHRARYRAA